MKDRELIRRFITAVNILDGVYYRIAKNSGIGENRLALFYALDDGKTHSQKQICEEWLIPKTTLNSVLKDCETEGLVELHGIPHERREMTICVTDKGKEYSRNILADLYEAEDEAMKTTLKRFSSEFTEASAFFAEQFRIAEVWIFTDT